MRRDHLLGILEAYEERWADARIHRVMASFDAGQEAARVERVLRFVCAHPECFQRTCAPGHMTGAALVTNPDFSRVLLTHHRKLNAWLQLGGHADGHPVMHEVALREAQEESGLAGLAFAACGTLLGAALRGMETPLPFDLDVHRIPAQNGEPPHHHYDVRYLLVADDSIPFTVSDESHDLRWLALDEARSITAERSMHRMFDKLELIRGLRDAVP